MPDQDPPAEGQLGSGGGDGEVEQGQKGEWNPGDNDT